MTFQNNDKRESLRKLVIKEIYTTETTYIKQLELIMKHFMNPIKTLKYLPAEEFDIVFGNIGTIYNINKELLHELESNLENVGSAFLKLAPFFKLYSFYAYDYKRSISILQNTQKTNQKFKKFLEDRETSREVQTKLISLLITPIQRIPRYRLLLREVVNYTDSTHSTYKMLSDSLKQVERATTHINNLVEEYENTERILDLQRRLQHPCIIKPGRRLVKEGTLLKISRKRNRSQPRYFILMTDILIYCKISQSNQVESSALRCSCILPLNKCKVDKMLSRSAFKLTCQNEVFVLYAEQQSETTGWMIALTQSIQQQIEYRKTLRKDSSRRQPMRKKFNTKTDYLGLSPALLRQKVKFQEFDDIFYVGNNENQKNNKHSMRIKKRQLTTEINCVQEHTSKRLKTSPALDTCDSLPLPEESLPFHKPAASETIEHHSKLYDMFCRIKNTIIHVFNLK